MTNPHEYRKVSKLKDGSELHYYYATDGRCESRNYTHYDSEGNFLELFVDEGFRGWGIGEYRLKQLFNMIGNKDQ